MEALKRTTSWPVESLIDVISEAIPDNWTHNPEQQLRAMENVFSIDGDTASLTEEALLLINESRGNINAQLAYMINSGTPGVSEALVQFIDPEATDELSENGLGYDEIIEVIQEYVDKQKRFEANKGNTVNLLLGYDHPMESWTNKEPRDLNRAIFTRDPERKKFVPGPQIAQALENREDVSAVIRKLMAEYLCGGPEKLEEESFKGLVELLESLLIPKDYEPKVKSLFIRIKERVTRSTAA